MASMLNKITDKLTGNTTSTTTTTSSGTGYNSGSGGLGTSSTTTTEIDYSSSSSSSSDDEGNKYSTEQRLARKTQRRTTMSREDRNARQMRRMERSGYKPRKHHRSLMDKLTGTNKSGYEETSSTRGTGLSGALGSLGIENKLTEDKVFHEAPVVKERIHHSYEHADQTEVIEVRDRTEVKTVVQPVLAEEQRGLDVERLNEGTEIHEHGSRGLDANAEAQLRARREEIARQGGTEVTEERTDVSARPDVATHERVHVIEQVQPVIEKDIYVPHRVEHYKKEVEIVHEAPVMGGTRVAPAISIDEFQRQHGDLNVSSSTSRTTYGTSSSSSSSSSDEGGNRYTKEQRLARKTQRRSNMSREERHARQMRRMQRSGYQPKKHHRTLMDKLTGKNKDTSSYGQTSSSSYGSSTTGYNQKEGVGEKVKNAVAGYDTNPATGSHTTGTTGSTGVNQKEGIVEKAKNAVVGYDTNPATGSHTTGTTGTTGKEGVGEKVKNAVAGRDTNPSTY